MDASEFRNEYSKSNLAFNSERTNAYKTDSNPFTISEQVNQSSGYRTKYPAYQEVPMSLIVPVIKKRHNATRYQKGASNVQFALEEKKRKANLS